ncbi:unnamed protein product [Dracunculus medinensis]|uniref:Hcy-binding domain-containing protein n=1 Tax=Dracunculus medinensis TaxID=318479 RepID=A0A0N4UD49_DRAME|nr:unnamed protein product [Dracunculus medinensis]
MRTFVFMKSVGLARRAVRECSSSRPIQIIGAIGSYATILFDGSEYNGHYIDTIDEKTVVDYFLQQSKPLLQADLKILAFETIPAFKEALCILQALDRMPDDIKCWISFSCKNGQLVNHGENFAECVKKIIVHPKLIAIGVNCTKPSFITSLLNSAQKYLGEKFFVVYPNSGEKYDAKTKRWLPPEDEDIDFDKMIPEWKTLGAKLIGGCCRMKPEDIRKISAVIAFLNNKS